MLEPPTAYLSPKLCVEARPEKGGYGIYACQFISAGDLIAVWSGIVVTPERLQTLPLEIQRHTVQVEEDLYLASINPDEPPDYINHSCGPNAGMSGQIALVAMRDIAEGEEVTLDYAMCDGTPYDEFECECGLPGCRGRIRGDDWRRPELQERYAGYFSPYLQRRIDRLKKQTAPETSP